MKSIFENVIARGGYDLTAILGQIDMYHVEGKLTDEERTDLYAKARAGAAPQYDYKSEIEAIWAAIRALQAGKSTEPTDPGTTDEWPEFVQPTGAHNAYNNGDKVSYKGKRYTCTMDNCIWAPDVYPSAWTEEGAA